MLSPAEYADLYDQDTIAELEYEIQIPAGWKVRSAELRIGVQTHVNATMPSPLGAWKHTWEPHRDIYRISACPPLPFPLPFRDELIEPWSPTQKDPRLPIGETHGGQVVWWYYTREGSVHGLVSGQTGAGKTVSAYVPMVTAVMLGFTVVILDPKESPDWVWLERYPNVRFAHTMRDMTKALKWTEEERARRSRVRMQEERDELPLTVFPPMFVYCDEAGSLFERKRGRQSGLAEIEDNMRGDCSHYVKQIATKGRDAGVHLLIATHRPRADYFDSDTKFCLGFRIGLGDLDGQAAKMIFDTTEQAADKDLNDDAPAVVTAGHGYCTLGGGRIAEIQCFYLPKDEGKRRLGPPPPPKPDPPKAPPKQPEQLAKRDETGQPVVLSPGQRPLTDWPVRRGGRNVGRSSAEVDQRPADRVARLQRVRHPGAGRLRCATGPPPSGPDRAAYRPRPARHRSACRARAACRAA